MADDTTSAPTLTVPLNPDGTIGALPDPLQKFFDQKIAQVSKRFEGKGGLPDPVERERLRQLEDENQRFKVSEAEREKRYEDALKMRDDEWSRKFKDTEAELEKRTQRIVGLIGAEVRAAALRYGAREDSLEDIEALLDRRIAIGDDLQAVVLNDKGEPTDTSVEDLVKSTLERKPYFRHAPSPGGGARGGAYVATGAAADSLATQLSAALDAYGKAPTPENMNRYLALQREAQRAAAGA